VKVLPSSAHLNMGEAPSRTLLPPCAMERQVRPRNVPIGWVCLLGTAVLAWPTEIHAYYLVWAAQAGEANITDDDTCNLADAIDCINRGGVDAHGCVAAGDNDPAIWLDNARLGTELAPPRYQLGRSAVISTGRTMRINGAELETVIESADATVFDVSNGATLLLEWLTVRHRGTGKGRVVTNHGDLTLRHVRIAGGDVSGRFCPASAVSGADVLSTGCGGGIYSDGNLTVLGSRISGNRAVKGGGIYVDISGIGLDLVDSTLDNNRAVNFDFDATSHRGGTATSTGSLAAGCSAAKAFDDDATTAWCVRENAAIIAYDFEETTDYIVRRYSLTANRNEGPRSWMLEASNNGGEPWVVLDRQTDQSWSSPSVPRSYSFANDRPYQLYRLRMESGGSGLSVAEIELFDQTGDGGAIYARGRTNAANSTLSGNIAGCTTDTALAPCACDAWCSDRVNRSDTMGAGGGVYHLDWEGGHYFSGTFLTVAANSAATGGGIFDPVPTSNGGVGWSIVARNTARATGGAPDYFGAPHGSFPPESPNERNMYSSSVGLYHDPMVPEYDEIRSVEDIGLCPFSTDDGPNQSVHLLRPSSVAIDRATSMLTDPTRLRQHDQRGFLRSQPAPRAACLSGDGSACFYDLGAVEWQKTDPATCAP
jgi:hypothetical protein